MPRISVVICTHNRAEYLRKAIQSLAQQTIGPATEYEVIIVDNTSTDHTPVVVEEFRSLLPGIQYMYEARIGLSWARNTGAHAATAPYVAYLDDDACAETQWLEALVQSFETVSPPPAAVGGRVWLDWGSNIPSWIPHRYWSLYTYLDHGDEPHHIGAKEHLVGANMAFKREILLAKGGFDPRLGRKGASLLSGEESALLDRLRESHLSIFYNPQAVVWHAVPEIRRKRRWLLARLFWDGASQPLLNAAEVHSRTYYLLQGYRDLKRIAFFLYQSIRLFIQGNIMLSQENALIIIQRLGRLRTHMLLALRAI